MGRVVKGMYHKLFKRPGREERKEGDEMNKLWEARFCTKSSQHLIERQVEEPVGERLRETGNGCGVVNRAA